MGRKRGRDARRNRLRCGRCLRRAPRDLESEAAEDWNGQWRHGQLVLVLCPDCQTPDEVAEAEVNAAELRVGTQDGGQFVADPVLCLAGTMAQPGAVLYGHDHLQRAVLTGQAAHLQLIENLPVATRCVATVGGVMIYLPR